MMIDGFEDEEYKAFVEKFKKKKTTDDCYTPPVVYDAVADWVEKTYLIDKSRFVRPFYPGGDFEKYEYPPGAVVVDNPPFSIISKIVSVYAERKIGYFLFAPALTLFSSSSSSTALPCGVTITYENGAKVSTSFLTNLEPPEIRARTAPDLYAAVYAANEKNTKEKKRALPRYEYPDHIITAAMVQRWCKYGVEYTLKRDESMHISALDAQKARGLAIFGCGYILGTRAAAERAAAERAAAERFELSDAEREIVRWIDEKAQDDRKK